jgi:hypothetical protein
MSRAAWRPSLGVLELAAEFSKPHGTSRGFSSRNAPRLYRFQRGLEFFEQLRSIESIFPASTAERLYCHEIAVTITLVDLGDSTPEILSRLSSGMRWNPASHHRRPGDLAFPGDDLAVRKRSRNRVAVDRPVDVVLHVLFAGPHDFDRGRNLFGDAHCALDHVRLEPAAEAATEVVVVDRHLVDRQTRGLSRILLAPALHLRAGPDLAGTRRALAIDRRCSNFARALCLPGGMGV